MDTLEVRVYNVRFGDAILISVPDRDENTGETQTRYVLIDVGNVLSGEGGDNVVFQPVVENILSVLDGRPVDLYVMTHEHMDHVQGLPYAAWKLEPPLEIDVAYAWFTASADPGYYENGKHPRSKEFADDAKKVYNTIDKYFRAALESDTDGFNYIQTLMGINSPSRTKECVEYLQGLTDKVAYVHRDYDGLDEKHPFKEAKFEIWAPEEDTSVYYGRFRSMALGLTGVDETTEGRELIEPKPPAGVDAGDFYNLVNIRNHGYVDNLLTIDRAANNTSVVFSLEWRGWKLLFTGDAERRSWKHMNKEGVLEPIHFLKVSHHGSHTGVPDSKFLEKILPTEPPDERPRRAVVSTYPDTYKGVPDKDLLREELSPRCEVTYLEKGTVPDGECLPAFEFEG